MRSMMLRAALALTLATTTVVAQEAQVMEMIDTNHDGAVSLDEAQSFAQIGWRKLDVNGEGKIVPADVQGVPGAAAFLGGVAAGEKGEIGREQFFGSVATRFKAADHNDDGFLDLAELRAYLGLPTAAVASAAPAAPVGIKLQNPSGLPACTELASQSRFGLAGHPGVSKISVRSVPAAGSTRVAYCQVDFTYNSGKAGPKHGYDEGQSQAIGIRVGLPLRADDGGSGSWNGRIQNLGSGGCMGNLPNVTVATNAGYVGASNDGGHGAPYIGFNCDFGVIQDKNRNNEGLIRDFSRDNVIWQTYWSKQLTRIYYGQPQERTYWAGCSQGGRQGHIVAQTIPGEYDGILAGGSALYWMRFQMAQAWAGVVVKDMLRSRGKDLSAAQIATTTRLAIAACDALDGVEDGVLGDPRQCRWSAQEAICGKPGASAEDCLDADQAAAYDAIRNGPRNSRGELLWFPWEHDTTFVPRTDYLLAESVMRWALRDLTFDSNAHLYMDEQALRRAADPRGITYEDMATLASQRLSDLADTDDVTLDEAAASGVKIISWTGTADRNIQSRNSIKYYRDVAEHLGLDVSSPRLQQWFRLFLYPGVDHCSGGIGPQPGDIASGPLFQALVDWVEKGQAPERIIATGQTPEGIVTRPVCPYPKTAIYKGTGSTAEADNFTCGGNLETPAIIEQDRLAKHKFENGSGKVPPPYGAPPQAE